MTNKAYLASLRELESPEYKHFVAGLEAILKRCNLGEKVNYSKQWEYPWIWFNGLRDAIWDLPGAKVLDIGSELSPMPWHMARNGANVTMTEMDATMAPKWRQLAADFACVDWVFVRGYKLPFEDESFDIVTSFSVLEHQSDKHGAIYELARVLKPGGLLALSFDICEESWGMKYPNDGRSMSLSDFEECVWWNSNFNNTLPPKWNDDDIPEFLEWHKKTEPHHTYVTGAAVLYKQ